MSTTSKLNQWKTEWAERNTHEPVMMDHPRATEGFPAGQICRTCGTQWPCAVEVEARDTEGHVTWADTGSGTGYTPEDQVARLRKARDELDTAEQVMVANLRVEGWTWQDIGDLYGTTRQAAQMRFRALSKPVLS